jgi:hypothetical protein
MKKRIVLFATLRMAFSSSILPFSGTGDADDGHYLRPGAALLVGLPYIPAYMLKPVDIHPVPGSTGP